VGDLIREACLIQLRDEVPHGMAVRIDDFKERENGMVYIAATIFVERESQKGIVIGEGGKMLKSIGSAARKEIEEMGGHKVFGIAREGFKRLAQRPECVEVVWVWEEEVKRKAKSEK
jgi:GTPase Era involved in 16S rRNA processing